MNGIEIKIEYHVKDRVIYLTMTDVGNETGLVAMMSMAQTRELMNDLGDALKKLDTQDMN